MHTCKASAALDAPSQPAAETPASVRSLLLQACHMAFPHMRPGQRANCIPGVRAITLKKEFVQSWQEVRMGCICAPRHAHMQAQRDAMRSSDTSNGYGLRVCLRFTQDRGAQLLPLSHASCPTSLLQRDTP